MLEAKKTKLKLSNVRSITRRRGSLEKTKILGETGGSRERGRPDVRQTDSEEPPQGASAGAEQALTGHWAPLTHRCQMAHNAHTFVI